MRAWGDHVLHYSTGALACTDWQSPNTFMFVDMQKEQQSSAAAYQEQVDKHTVELQREQQHAAVLTASVAQLKAQAKVHTLACLPQFSPLHPSS